MMAIAMAVTSCKKDDKVVGKDKDGNELIVNEKGDTIPQTETNNEVKTDSITKPEVVAVTKGADEKYSYQYNLEIGKTYPMNLSIKNTQSASDGKQSQKMTSESKKQIDYTVKDFKDGVYTLEVKSKQYSEKMTDPTGKSISYDTSSAKPANKDIAVSWSIYKAMTGKTYTMKIDQKGKVVSVDGLDVIKKSILNSVKSQVNAEEFKLFTQIIDNSLNKEAISSQFEETMNVFPNKTLALKESWSDSQKIDKGPMKGNISMKRTLSNVEDQHTTITVAGSQSLKGNESQEGVKMSANSNANVDGKILIDTKSGWINKVNLTKKETLKRTVEAQGQSQTMTETATTVTTVN
ncbi:hypothetical protein SAMN05443634_10255 [Chishuiella changwenlii]|uniref:Uncharacterized protein n=3 Tax=Chishuiella changwenlii TaxID=1434701 RepID=A0A1M6TR46_9FLAO|nr:hypothetical protein SAMN05443634_10255 [Chishuiella changwenlii]